MEYRRKAGSDTWHFCTNCSNWPTGREGVDYVTRSSKPNSGELDNECLAKQRQGICRSKS